MLYSEIEKSSSLDLCRSLGRSIETDIKRKHLKKKDVAKAAGINEMTLHRICTGQNVKLDSVIRVLRVVNRSTALIGLVTPSPVEPMSLYNEMLKERKDRLKKAAAGRGRTQTSAGSQTSSRASGSVTSRDVMRLCE